MSWTYIVAATQHEAEHYALEKGLNRWRFVTSPRTLEGLRVNRVTFVFIDGWMKHGWAREIWETYSRGVHYSAFTSKLGERAA